ncbi:MAG: ATP-binding protein [Desulfobulbaceae bacterium]|nr:ATP-binding protein [Desulfobulbaceae bacterium]
MSRTSPQTRPPLLTVAGVQEPLSSTFALGLSIRDILDTTPLRVRSACGGGGSCGLCRVIIKAGEINPPSPAELARFSPAQLQQGMRLACRVFPRGDCTILLDNPAPPSPWRTLPATTAESAGGKPQPPYGVAVDLGTTSIRLSLWELDNRRRLTGRSGPNPQQLLGADVLSRLVAAAESPARAGEISTLARAALAAALADMASREAISAAGITRLALVGNTAMLALLTGDQHHSLLIPDNWTKSFTCQPPPGDTLARELGLAATARIEIIQPLAGFVGSDLLAGLIATRLTGSSDPALLIDFGTNSEIALWDGHRLWISSAAGGPAFEGCGISCGCPAEAGAIFRVCRTEGTGTFSCEVLAGGSPQGLCGSGLIDLVALLAAEGLLKRNGRFGPGITLEGFPLAVGSARFYLRQADIDVLQRAKAAVAAGTACLLRAAGMRPGDLSRLCVGGAFGEYLQIASAQAIGLLPEIAPERIELCGNTALAGCEELLLNPTTALSPGQEKSNAINLALAPEFENLFIKNLYIDSLVIGE